MTVSKEKNKKTWMVDISDGLDNISGKRKRYRKKGFISKQEAEKYEADFRVFELTKVRPNNKIDIAYLFSLMEQEDKISGKKISYVITQRNNFYKYFEAYFSKADMKKLDYKDVINFREFLLTSPNRVGGKLSINTVNKQMILFKKILEVAVRRGIIASNPCKLVKKLPIPKKVMSYYTAEEFREFLKLFTEEEYSYKLFFKLLFFTGMRLGEALALTWKDIDFIQGYIMVSKSIYYYKNEPYMGTPKNTTSIRKIYIHQALIDELKEWRKKQSFLLGKYEKDFEGVQIYQYSAVPLTKYNVDNMKRNVDKRRGKELKKIRIHDFRHSHASYLINNNIEPMKLSKRLGHASITTTLDTYSHLYPDTQKSVASIFDDFE
ncbi:site-specific integrase [Lactococcus lactis subsp. lactis]|uniref:site-specific integrase n=1 Tax=Lactococcus lactis TaxID=1358 RepID=UPI0021AEDFBA|nr:tyrosine-type recombinase/integrase [Lactococcus lactis]MCT0016747.1 site-specific integrase [Lactococcus lactis subsp. lactis]